MRLFFAILLPQPVVREINHAVAVLRNQLDAHLVRWVRPKNMHITVRFLGEVDEQVIQRLVQAVKTQVQTATAPIDVFEIELDTIDFFPNQQHPRVISLLVKSVALQQLADRVESGVLAAGFSARDKPFRGHLSIGRIKKHVSNMAHSIDNLVIKPQTVTVERIALMQSIMRADGVEYQQLQTISLCQN